jgi:aminobenzoyl-glutamate transport protein
VLDWIEWLGNLLPDPATLFVIGAVLVVVLSQIGAWQGWSVTKTVAQPVMAPVLDSGSGEMVRVKRVDAQGRLLRAEDGVVALSAVDAPATRMIEVVSDDAEAVVREEAVLEPVQVEVRAVGLLTRDGLNWAIQSMVANFVNFPPLGVVLVGMLGIGVAEKTGAIGALLKALALITPMRVLTPSMVFIGIMSSMALDAGYVVLPPVAAALYKSVGRSPLVGLAAVFSGIGAGFSANLLPTGLDPLLAGFTASGAQILDPTVQVAATCNWWFMIVSTVLLTGLGWAVTALFVEPRFERKSADEGGPSGLTSEDAAAKRMTPEEKKGLAWAGVAFAVVFGGILAMILIPGAALNGIGARFDRWVEAIVPILFFSFLAPGLAYGIATGSIRSDKASARLMGQTMADMGPYIVLAFFAAQFVEYFKHSKLGEMLAIVGGNALASADMPVWMLLAAFILVVAAANLFIGSASAKYAIVAPVFVPMFMRVGVSPELTQAAYRVGDSATNIIAPLNPYIIVLLVFMHRYVPKAGIGTLVSLMLPYSIVFVIVWTALLVAWVAFGWELGPGGPLVYEAVV